MRSAAPPRPWSITIDESYRHVLSDEPTEYLDQRGEERFDRRGDGSDAVRLDTRDHAVQVNHAVVDPANVLQRRMVRFRASERPSEQRVASILAHGIAQVFGYAQAGHLQRGADHVRITVSPRSGLVAEEAASDLK